MKKLNTLLIIILFSITFVKADNLVAAPAIAGDDTLQYDEEFRKIVLNWTITDDNPKGYSIYLNHSSLIGSGEWENQNSNNVKSIELNLNLILGQGLYLITLEVNDYDNLTSSFNTVIGIDLSNSELEDVNFNITFFIIGSLILPILYRKKKLIEI